MGRLSDVGAPGPIPLHHRARQAQMRNGLYLRLDENQGLRSDRLAADDFLRRASRKIAPPGIWTCAVLSLDQDEWVAHVKGAEFQTETLPAIVTVGAEGLHVLRGRDAAPGHRKRATALPRPPIRQTRSLRRGRSTARSAGSSRCLRTIRSSRRTRISLGSWKSSPPPRIRSRSAHRARICLLYSIVGGALLYALVAWTKRIAVS